jgi:hypothetical protein
MRKLLKPVLAMALATTGGAPAYAANFSFVGNFQDRNDVQLVNFRVGASPSVTIRTHSYAGGINAAGNLIARGGFDPFITIFNAAGDWTFLQNDDGRCFSEVAMDAVTGRCYDSFLTRNLAPGDYIAALLVLPNRPAGLNLGAGFTNTGNLTDSAGFLRTGAWAIDFLNVESASLPGVGNPGVPEPASWALMIAGFGLTGAAIRRRAKVGVEQISGKVDA